MTWQVERLEHNRLARAQRGDEDAFAQLTEPYRRELQLHCYRIVGSLQDAEDLLQELWLEIHRKIVTFRGSSEREFLMWVRRMIGSIGWRLMETHGVGEGNSENFVVRRRNLVQHQAQVPRIVRGEIVHASQVATAAHENFKWPD